MRDKRMKIKNYMFYCSDFHGFGHFTRTLRIVNFLAKNSPDSKFYIFTNKVLRGKNLLSNIEIVMMPEISVQTRPRDCRYMEVLYPEIKVWSDFLKEQIDKINPCLFYSDLNPNGGYGELRNVFPFLKEKKIKTVLGLRDILDGIEQTKKEWLNEGKGIITLNDYDKLLVYGDESIFRSLYSELIDVDSVIYAGYIFPEKILSKGKRDIDVFAMFGGGGRSKEQIEYVASLISGIGLKSVIVTGPLFSEENFNIIKRKYVDVEFIRKTDKIVGYLLRTKLTITHCGYNSMLESFLHSERVLLFPRVVNTRKEQIFRAEFFKKKGYCDFIDVRADIQENKEKIKSCLSGDPIISVSMKNGLCDELLEALK